MFITDFEKKFVFHEEYEFPEPEEFSNRKKEYPSQVINSKYEGTWRKFVISLNAIKSQSCHYLFMKFQVNPMRNNKIENYINLTKKTSGYCHFYFFFISTMTEVEFIGLLTGI